MKIINFLLILSNYMINGLKINKISSFLDVRKGQKAHMFGNIYDYQDTNISTIVNFGVVNTILHSNGEMNWHWYLKTDKLEESNYNNNIVFVNNNQSTNISFEIKVFNQNPSLLVQKKFIRYDIPQISNNIIINDKFKYLNISNGKINYIKENIWQFNIDKKSILNTNEIKLRLFLNEKYYTENNFFIIKDNDFVYHNFLFDLLFFNDDLKEYFIDVDIVKSSIKDILHLDDINIECSSKYLDNSLITKYSIVILNINEYDCIKYNETIQKLVKNKKYVNYLLNTNNFIDNRIFVNNTRIENITFIYEKEEIQKVYFIYVFFVYLFFLLVVIILVSTFILFQRKKMKKRPKQNNDYEDINEENYLESECWLSNNLDFDNEYFTLIDKKDINNKSILDSVKYLIYNKKLEENNVLDVLILRYNDIFLNGIKIHLGLGMYNKIVPINNYFIGDNVLIPDQVMNKNIKNFSIYVSMKYYSNTFLNLRCIFNEESVLMNALFEMMDILNYLSKYKVCHMNIHEQNIFLNDKNKLLLGDFKCSIKCDLIKTEDEMIELKKRLIVMENNYGIKYHRKVKDFINGNISNYYEEDLWYVFRSQDVFSVGNMFSFILEKDRYSKKIKKMVESMIKEEEYENMIKYM